MSSSISSPQVFAEIRQRGYFAATFRGDATQIGAKSTAMLKRLRDETGRLTLAKLELIAALPHPVPVFFYDTETHLPLVAEAVLNLVHHVLTERGLIFLRCLEGKRYYLVPISQI